MVRASKGRGTAAERAEPTFSRAPHLHGPRLPNAVQAKALSQHGEEYREVVRNLRGGANGGAAGINQPLGGHRQGYTQPRDRVYLRLGAFVDALPLIQRERLQEAPARFGLQHIVHQAGFAGPRKPRHNAELALGEFNIYLFQVVHARPAHLNLRRGSISSCRRNGGRQDIFLRREGLSRLGFFNTKQPLRPARIQQPAPLRPGAGT